MVREWCSVSLGVGSVFIATTTNERIVMLQRLLENVTVLLLAGILAGAAGGAVLGIILEHSASSAVTTSH